MPNSIPIDDVMLRARGEAVQEVIADMLLAAGNALLRHGDDPKAHVILSAATEGFIDQVDRIILPGFRGAMAEILRGEFEP